MRKQSYKQLLQIQTLSFIKRKKQADDLYVSFYIQHKNQVAHYFRTLYRIFCFIDNSELKEREKVEYAKIMRAQLSESELFFLYYNAFTSYGYNFQYIINKYNLIKHSHFQKNQSIKSTPHYWKAQKNIRQNQFYQILDD